jgi:hypothetical protein
MLISRKFIYYIKILVDKNRESGYLALKKEGFILDKIRIYTIPPQSIQANF